MTAEAEHFIKQFATLPDSSKHEVLAELLRLCNQVNTRSSNTADLFHRALCCAASSRFASSSFSIWMVRNSISGIS
jgi:hypothetical protein